MTNARDLLGAALAWMPGDGGAGVRVSWSVADVADEAAVSALFAELGDFDHLVLTAGESLRRMPLDDL